MAGTAELISALTAPLGASVHLTANHSDRPRPRLNKRLCVQLIQDDMHFWSFLVGGVV